MSHNVSANFLCPNGMGRKVYSVTDETFAALVALDTMAGPVSKDGANSADEEEEEAEDSAGEDGAEAGVEAGVEVQPPQADQEGGAAKRIFVAPWEDEESFFKEHLHLYASDNPQKTIVVDVVGSFSAAMAAIRAKMQIRSFVASEKQRNILYQALLLQIMRELIAGDPIWDLALRGKRERATDSATDLANDRPPTGHSQSIEESRASKRSRRSKRKSVSGSSSSSSKSV
jgi:hypothetical protein